MWFLILGSRSKFLRECKQKGTWRRLLHPLHPPHPRDPPPQLRSSSGRQTCWGARSGGSPEDLPQGPTAARSLCEEHPTISCSLTQGRLESYQWCITARLHGGYLSPGRWTMTHPSSSNSITCSYARSAVSSPPFPSRWEKIFPIIFALLLQSVKWQEQRSRWESLVSADDLQWTQGIFQCTEESWLNLNYPSKAPK